MFCMGNLEHKPGEAPSPVRRIAITCFILLLFGALFGPALVMRLRLLTEPYILNDDARMWIAPFLRYTYLATPERDYLSNYALALTPAGFKHLMMAFSMVLHPITVGKVMSIALLAPLMAGFAIGARRLSGHWGMLATMGLALSSPLFVERMAGGVARAFAYPVLALAAAALITGRVRWLCVLTVAGAAFYPVAGVAPGLALFLLLFVYPPDDRAEASGWSFRKRSLYLFATVGLSVSLLLPALLGSREYGRALAPADVTEYPEIGPEGRLESPSRAPFPNVFSAVRTQAARSLRGVGDPLLSWIPGYGRTPMAYFRDRTLPPALLLQGLLLSLMLIGVLLQLQSSAELRRLTALLVAAMAMYVAAAIFAPYLYMPSRHVSYPIPVLVMFLLPAAGAELGSRVARMLGNPPATWATVTGAAVLTLLCLVPLGGRGSAMSGLRNEETVWPLAQFVAALPESVFIAGWPDDTMDDIPYFTGRRAFLNFECHLPFHQAYTEEMRKRFAALSGAYLAHESGPLFDLRDRHRVTHLIVDRRVIQKVPKYFAPFREPIAELWATGSPNTLEVLKQMETSSVFQTGPYVVLDLSKLRR